MKVVAFNGSPRKGGNTETLTRCVLAELEREGIETELVQLGGKAVRGCVACTKCFENLDKRCAIDSDVINSCIAKMVEADGIILASPTYFADVSTEIKALIDRAGLVARANDDMFRRKVGAAVVAVRRAGAVAAFDSINHMFAISQMIIPCSIYWNLGIGLRPGDVNEDEEGLKTMQVLGQNMAWLLKKLHQD
ncbi:MAG: flavodoxin family protein [Lentisphaerae bacterium]|jgi:multimeric flavodoxin WrbA|nr:flavodoxin family protein [Lentisphaerota bacterium]MBT4820418.1 flavodoxin family protein [Lentisphaerota bacterium]MBT5608880.1 flavodoxin family protein [Lentisphaerota bacterium]MBT7057408.1 flavodoxin family protein [Lentisphaerota bacterium]MBT7842746.1 flavodoxin family protein [Lentisphaerota bacterium]